MMGVNQLATSVVALCHQPNATVDNFIIPGININVPVFMSVRIKSFS